MSIEPTYPNSPRNGKVFAGLILLTIGGVLLLRQLTNFFFPDWLISWPMFMIALGLYIGAKHNFRRPVAPVILILLGVMFLADNVFPGFDISRMFWPVIIIAFGLWMILGRRQQWKRQDHSDFSSMNSYEPINPNGPAPVTDYENTVPPAQPAYNTGGQTFNGDDHIDMVSVFGGHKRTILSKNFQGGDIVNIFGGTDLDLTQADINGRIVIDVTQLFGGIKLIIPPHWQVTSDVAAIFSNVDDKRRGMGTALSPDKIIVIKGVSIFAGVDIRSF